MTETSVKTEESRVGLQIGVGLLVSVIAVVILLLFIDVRDALDAIEHADYRWLPVAIAIYLAGLASRAVAFRVLLNNQVSFSRSFWTLSEGYMFNNVLPLRMGELGRCLLLNLTEGLSFWRVLSTIVVERVFDVGFMALVLLATTPFAIGVESASQIALVVGLLVVIGFVVLFIAARRPDLIVSLFEWITSPFPKLMEFGREKLASILEGLTSLADTGRFLTVLLWMALAWVFNIGYYFALLRAFIPDAGIIMAGFVVGAGSMGVALPSSPGYVGVFHGTIVAALNVFGITNATALGYAIVAHLGYVLISSVLGAFALGRDGLSLVDVFRKLLSRRDQPERVG
jgi:hypothetical protein